MVGGHDYVVLMRRPDGSAIYTTRACIAQYGLEVLRAIAREQIRAEFMVSGSTPG